MHESKSSPRVGNESDGDWEMVSNLELNDSGVLVDKSEPGEDEYEEEIDPLVPTFVEADILAQIKRMFKQRVNTYYVFSSISSVYFPYFLLPFFCSYFCFFSFFVVLFLRTMVVILLPMKRPFG